MRLGIETMIRSVLEMNQSEREIVNEGVRTNRMEGDMVTSSPFGQAVDVLQFGFCRL